MSESTPSATPGVFARLIKSLSYKPFCQKCGTRRARGRPDGLRMSRMKFVVTIEADEDGGYVVECPAIPGCVSQGETEEEALANIREAIQLCLEVRAEEGLPLTIETREVEIPA